jgi:hypothetical protein
MSEYKAKKYMRCSKCKKKATRDLSFDNVQGVVAFSLSECKTIGHYAEKQTSQYSKDQVEEIRRNQKTKRVSSHEELPKGMERMEKPSDAAQWTSEGKTKRKPRRRK